MVIVNIDDHLNMKVVRVIPNGEWLNNPGNVEFQFRYAFICDDDGIKVMVNGVVLGHMKLDDPGTSWNLASVLEPGRNTLIVILVDDSERNKFIQDMAFYRAGEMVTGTEVPPPGR